MTKEELRISYNIAQQARKEAVVNQDRLAIRLVEVERQRDALAAENGRLRGTLTELVGLIERMPNYSTIAAPGTWGHAKLYDARTVLAREGKP